MQQLVQFLRCACRVGSSPEQLQLQNVAQASSRATCENLAFIHRDQLVNENTLNHGPGSDKPHSWPEKLRQQGPSLGCAEHVSTSLNIWQKLEIGTCTQNVKRRGDPCLNGRLVQPHSWLNRRTDWLACLRSRVSMDTKAQSTASVTSNNVGI